MEIIIDHHSGSYVWCTSLGHLLPGHLLILSRLPVFSSGIIMQDQQSSHSSPVANLGVIIVNSTRISPMMPTEEYSGSIQRQRAHTGVVQLHNLMNSENQNCDCISGMTARHYMMYLCNSTKRTGQHSRPSREWCSQILFNFLVILDSKPPHVDESNPYLLSINQIDVEHTRTLLVRPFIGCPAMFCCRGHGNPHHNEYLKTNYHFQRAMIEDYRPWLTDSRRY